MGDRLWFMGDRLWFMGDRLWFMGYDKRYKCTTLNPKP